VEERQVIQTLAVTPRTDIAELRKQLSRGLVKFRDIKAPRTVFIKCIMPRSPAGESKTAKLERLLGRDVTHELMHYYQSTQMQGRYRLVVDVETYKWDDKDISCSSTGSSVTSAKIDQFDYSIGGVVAISSPQSENNFGYDDLDLEIDVWLSRPDCQRVWHIPDRLNPSEYFDLVSLARSVSQQLPEKFGPAWVDNVEKKSCN
jgi:hypothetical protein